MKWLEQVFEGILWKSRFVVMLAVVASLLAGFAIFYIATVDVFFLIKHVAHYADPDLTNEIRKTLHDDTVSHVVEVVDGYLLATIMLIFSLGLYELFISDIDAAQGSKASSRVLVIHDLDDLKNRLAKVIVMIMIVSLFEHALKMKMTDPQDLLTFGGSIALIGLALFLMHRGEHHPASAQHAEPHHGEPHPVQHSAEHQPHTTEKS
ncbi:putative membrane protein YqhA [Methylovorus glucosotrophus]|jgi:uncharacterized membrane protein YqhA|uniref:YqhA family protein n=1 Tax=Methylovorus glucosotrophus TaxID=266009 RepID=UPI0013319D70|nr:YqhA family protein [Methylovorus glucosotrophus]KAF0843182.1 putative membrane protein YqhA [Methylovorus glucosotrophus]